MADENWSTIYEQLNLRGRWYGSQLWYVPFAYMAIVVIGLERIVNIKYPLNVIGLVFLTIFSLSVYVHIASIKYYERRVVRSLQDMESEKISGGGSDWYISFAWYIRAMILITSYAFIIYTITLLETTEKIRLFMLIASILVITILYIIIIWKDHNRNRDLRKRILKYTK